MRHKLLSHYLFVLLMLLSGFAGISYEILYGRILGNMVGDQFVVSAAILMTFLLGIGVGSAFAYRLWRWLWVIEGGIGLYGVIIAWNQPFIETVVYSGSSLFADHLLGSVLICVLLLIVPAFLIGCSVPLFAGYFNRLYRGSEDDGKASFPWVYMVYNLGAALTSLFIEFYFIRGLGIQGTVAAFAVVNIFIALGLRFSFAEISESSVQQHFSWKTLLFGMPRKTMIALVLASIASAIFQLFMIKYSELVFGPFRESFALVLSLVLLGITVGSLIEKHFRLSFQVVMWLNLLGLLWLMLAAGAATYVYAALYPLTGDSFWLVVILKWLVLTALMFLPATTFGATIPALLSHKGEVAHESGSLLFVSSLANVVGFLLMVFFLHRYLDYGVQLLTVAGISAMALIVYQRAEARRMLAAAMAIVLIGGVYVKQWDEDLLYLSYTNFKDYEELVDARKNVSFPERYKGYQDVFSINWMDGDPYFFINGYISIPLNNPSEKIVGALSTLYAPRLDDALVLGLGSGATASSVGLFFDKTDVVEINPVVRENLFRMAQWNFDIEGNERVNIYVDDAIHYIKAGRGDYSLILNTVTTPLYFSSSKLYTKNFFDDVKTRLKDDGVYVTWMDSRIGDKGADIILRSLQKSFKHCAVLYVKSAYFLLIASDKPLQEHQQQAVIEQPELRKNLMEKHEILSEWLPYQLMTTDVFSLIGEAQGDINTADYPALEFEMARLQESGIPNFKDRLRRHFNIQEIEQALPILPEAFPADFLAHARARLGDSSIPRRWQAVLSDDELFDKKDLAELAFRKAKMKVFNRPKDLHAYGYQLLKVERYAEAIKVYEAVLRLDPGHDNSHYNMAVCYEELGDDDTAIAYFKQELLVDPEDEDASYRMARLLLKKGLFADGLKVLNAYIEQQGGKSRKAYVYRAIAYKALGKNRQARQDMEKALRLKKDEIKMSDRVGLL